jgi:hypothetical protein
MDNLGLFLTGSSSSQIAAQMKKSASEYAEQSRRVRPRRTESSSEESDDRGFQFKVSNVKYRVAAPPARPLPIHTICSNETCKRVYDAVGPALERGVRGILIKHGIKLSEGPEVVYRCLPDDNSEGDVTVLTVARWQENSAIDWEKAVKEAKRFVNATVCGSRELQHIAVAVEIIAKELTLPTYVSPIPAEECTPELVIDWNHIKTQVHRILNYHKATEGRATTVCLFKYGFSKDLAQNPPTVYIAVDYESEEARWPPIIRELQEYLDRYHEHKLRVHIEHGIPDLYPPFQPLLRRMTSSELLQKYRSRYGVLRKYRTAVELGDDVGAETYITTTGEEKAMPGHGTMGCWVEIRTKMVPEWTTYALVNYHPIHAAIDGFQFVTDSKGKTFLAPPTQDSDLWKTDVHGIIPGATKFKSEPMKIEHPTRQRHRLALQYCQHLIEQAPNAPETKAKREYLDEIRAFFDNGNHVLGKIWAASGFTRRSPSGGRMDWALIKPDNPARIGKNTLPTLEEWVAARTEQVEESMYDMPSLPELPQGEGLGRLKQPPVHGTRSVKTDAPVYKKGARTGPTIGRFQRLRYDVRLRDDKHLEGVIGHYNHISQEMAFIGDPDNQWFAREGDSGSVVFDAEGRALGLLFRGHSGHNPANSSVYISPIEDVFHDIKELLKNHDEVTDIRIAED